MTKRSGEQSVMPCHLKFQDIANDKCQWELLQLFPQGARVNRSGSKHRLRFLRVQSTAVQAPFAIRDHNWSIGHRLHHPSGERISRLRKVLFSPGGSVTVPQRYCDGTSRPGKRWRPVESAPHTLTCQQGQISGIRIVRGASDRSVRMGLLYPVSWFHGFMADSPLPVHVAGEACPPGVRDEAQDRCFISRENKCGELRR